jgi:hypothetical protein
VTGYSIRAQRTAAARSTRDFEHERRMALRLAVLNRYGRLIIAAVQAGTLDADEAARRIVAAQNRTARRVTR